MICPRCGSDDCTAQIVTSTQLVTAHHGLLWWVFLGWWWVPLKWVCFFPLALLAKIFAPRRQKLNQQIGSMWVCHSCGNVWHT